MKLYELKRDSWFTFPGTGTLFKLERIDGAYSRCWTEDEELIHFASYTEVEYVEKPYDHR